MNSGLSRGLKGSLQLIAMLTALLAAMLAICGLFGWLPREELIDAAIKGFATLAIVALLSLALGLLLGRDE
ncbi:MAG: hypothetical protein Q8Q73_03925 [Stagnimonas sp.]|nr:hypothetical protein [Stagnimonas sp.]